jgi:hypothetical protein
MTLARMSDRRYRPARGQIPDTRDCVWNCVAVHAGLARAGAANVAAPAAAPAVARNSRTAQSLPNPTCMGDATCERALLAGKLAYISARFAAIRSIADGRTCIDSAGGGSAGSGSADSGRAGGSQERDAHIVSLSWWRDCPLRYQATQQGAVPQETRYGRPRQLRRKDTRRLVQERCASGVGRCQRIPPQPADIASGIGSRSAAAPGLAAPLPGRTYP